LDTDSQFILNDFITKSDPIGYTKSQQQMVDTPEAYYTKIRTKYAHEINTIIAAIKPYGKINLITASNGVFGNTVLALLIKQLNHKSVTLIYSSINLESFDYQENILKSITAAYPALNVSKCYFKNTQKYGNYTLDDYFNLIDDKIEKLILKLNTNDV
jgi:hypothetical protein